MSILSPKPTWETGIARSAAESVAPGKWQGLVGALSPSFGPTGATLRDVSGFQNHGTLTNMDPATDWVVGENGYALDFDGTLDHIALGDPSALNVSGPLSVFVMFRSTATINNMPLIARWGTDYSYVLMADYRTDNALVFFARVSGVSKEALGTVATYNDGNWHFATGVFDGANVRLYTDLETITGDATTGPISTPAQNVIIGNYSNLPGASYFPGQIAQVLIYNRALTPSEIRELYADPFEMFRLMRQMYASAGAAPTDIGGEVFRSNVFGNRIVRAA